MTVMSRMVSRFPSASKGQFLAEDAVIVTLPLKLTLEKELNSLFWQTAAAIKELALCPDYRSQCEFSISSVNDRDVSFQSDDSFGAGTKLTVLEPNRTITPPTVKVLQPSKNECQSRKDKKKKKTLVCVASHFYPDHVSVSWQINGENVTDGVATDNAALREGDYYSITSRLRVPLRKWFTEDKVFTCTVSFFNGTGTVHRYSWVQGVDGSARVKYLRITHAAKLTYTVLIIKSSMYGAFVMLLVWSLKASSGKQDD